jgi:putative restriction endonuclease
MKESLSKYLKAFKKLRIDCSHGGVAPHKPILLLSVCQAFQQKLFVSPRIYLSADLVALFKVNWNLLVTSKHDCRITYPFFYMKSEGFWRLVTFPEYASFITANTVIKGFNQLRTIVDYAEIDPELFQLLIDPVSNSMLTNFLLDEYFPATKIKFDLFEVWQAELFDDLQGKILNDDASEYSAEINELLRGDEEEEIFLRGSMFKREIPKIYNFSCCISGMNITVASNISMVDACHIIPFSESHDDTIANGITLCPNLHRAFDRRLIGIDSEYRVIVSKAS